MPSRSREQPPRPELSASSPLTEYGNDGAPEPEDKSEDESLSPDVAADVNENEEVVITNIRATDLALGLRRLPAGFYISVYHSNLEWRTENMHVSVNSDVVEWSGQIPLPSDLSASICLVVQASFGFQPMLGDGEQLRELTVAVGQLLDHNARHLPFTFIPKNGDVVSPCSSLCVTIGRQNHEGNDSGVLRPHRPATESRGQLIDITNKGHSALSRYRKHGEQRDLEHAIQMFEHALNICPQGHPSYVAALSNMAMAKSIHYRVHDIGASLHEALTMYRNVLAARPTDHPDRPSTLIQLAAVHLAQFERGQDEADATRAEAFLHEVVGMQSTSHENRAATLMLQLRPGYTTGATLVDQSSEGEDSASSSTDMDPLDSSFQLLCQFEQFGDLADLQQAISCLEGAIESTPVSDPCYLVALTNLGAALAFRFDHLGELSDLEEAISRQQNAVKLTPDDHSHKPGRLTNLGDSLKVRFGCLGEMSDLEEAISRLRDAATLTPDDHPDLPGRLNNLSSSLFARFEVLGELGDLEEAILRQQDSVNLTPDDHPQKPSRLTNLGSFFLTRFQRLGELSDLKDAISRQRDGVKLIPDDHPDKPRHLNNLGISLQTRFVHLGELSDLEEAISRQQDAVKLTPDDHPHKLGRLTNLGNSLKTRFDRLGELRDLEEAIMRQRDAANLTPNTHSDKPSHLNNLVISLLARFKRLGELGDLGEAISKQQDAVYLLPDDHTHRPTYLNNLSMSFISRFKSLGELDDLDKAISWQRDAVDLIPDDHPDKLGFVSNLGGFLIARFERLGELSDLEEAISKLENTVTLTPEDHPDRPGRLDSLGSSFLARFERVRELGDLEEAISSQQNAVRLTPDDHPLRPSRLANLSNSFGARFEHFGKLSDLAEAISILQGALDYTPDDHPDKLSRLSSLASYFFARFERIGDLSDLEEAISRQQDAVNLTPDDRPDKSGRLSNLGNSVFTRFVHLGELSDLDAAVLSQRDAVDLTPDDHPHKPGFVNNLGNILLTRFERLGKLSDLEEAILRLQDAADHIPDDHPHKPSCLDNLGCSFAARFECLGEPSDLDDAISRQQDAVNLTPNDHSRKPRHLNNLGISFFTRFERLKEPGDLDEAILKHQDAVRLTPNDHPHKAGYLNNLGNSFFARFKQLGERNDAELAVVCYSKAACSSVGSITARFRASRRWILCARLLRHHSLLSAYSVAISLLPQRAWIGLSLAHRYRELIQGSDVVCEAAAAALESGCPETAVEWLEQGRSIVWGDLFKLRGPYDELLSAYPDHGHRLRELSVSLEQAGAIREKSLYSQMDQVHGADRRVTVSLRQEADRHRMLAIERDKLLQDIRALPGFERFLLHTEFSQLRAAAHSGPVVILNAAETRCDAMIVLADVDHAIHVPLPNFSPKRSKEFQNVLKSVVRHTRDALHDDRYGQPVRKEDPGKWKPILAPLWKCVVKPVLDALALSTPGGLSRIFWCPTGLLTFLPIHAAGFYDARASEPGHKVFDFIVSSYVPTLSILLSSPKSETIDCDDLYLLGVRQPLSDGQPKLPGVHTELENIKTIIRNSASNGVTLMEPSAGTVEEVLDLMKDAHWVHFACHGVQDGTNPTNSGLCLADKRRLRISDIIALSRPHGGLAFLSACQTAKGDEDLSEEAIHIAAGMLFAGYGGVVGTMWSISDHLAPGVAMDVYQQLFRDGTTTPDYREAARALHVAVGRLRDRNVPFGDWLPFIHLGL